MTLQGSLSQFSPSHQIWVDAKWRQRFGPASLLGFEGCGKDTKNDGNYSEALGEDAAPHQQLGLSGFPLVEGPQTVEQGSRRSQTTWRTRRGSQQGQTR